MIRGGAPGRTPPRGEAGSAAERVRAARYLSEGFSEGRVTRVLKDAGFG